MIDVSTVQPVISAAIGSAVVAYYWYINNQVDPTKPSNKFDPVKLAPAVITGSIIGGLSVLFGVEPLTNQNVAVQMVSYGLITSVIETGIKTIVRYFSQEG